MLDNTAAHHLVGEEKGEGDAAETETGTARIDEEEVEEDDEEEGRGPSQMIENDESDDGASGGWGKSRDEEEDDKNEREEEEEDTGAMQEDEVTVLKQELQTLKGHNQDLQQQLLKLQEAERPSKRLKISNEDLEDTEDEDDKAASAPAVPVSMGARLSALELHFLAWESTEGDQPSIRQRLEALEVQVFGEVKEGSLQERIAEAEKHA